MSDELSDELKSLRDKSTGKKSSNSDFELRRVGESQDFNLEDIEKGFNKDNE